MRGFPFLCLPKDDEIFSSWIFRLSKGNSTDPSRFVKYLFPERSIFGQDCDLNLPEKFIASLSFKLDVPDQLVRETLLKSLVGNYLEEVKSNGHNRELLGAKTVGVQRKSAAQQFCSLCLQEDPEPYYRKKWRLTAFTVCPKHSVILSDRCASCGEVINCHRLTWFHQSAAFCFRCGKPLKRQLLIDLDSTFPILKFQSKLEAAILSGWYVLSDETVIRTPVFLEGLRFLSRPWFAEKSAKKMFDAFQDTTGFPFKTFQSDIFWPIRISRLSVLPRFYLYFVLAWLVDRWPENLIEFASKYSLTLTAFYKTDAAPPYWLHKVFDKHLNKKNYWVSMDEIRSAVRFLYRRNYSVSPGNVAEVVGLDRSVYLTKDRRKYIIRIRKMQAYKKIKPTKVFRWKAISRSPSLRC